MGPGLCSFLKLYLTFALSASSFFLHLFYCLIRIPASGTLPGKQKQVAMVQHPVQNRSGHLFIVEDIDPAGKLDIGVDDQRIAFITLGDHLKQQLGADSIQRYVTPLVANQKFRLEIFFIKTDRVPFFLASERRFTSAAVRKNLVSIPFLQASTPKAMDKKVLPVPTLPYITRLVLVLINSQLRR